MSWLLVLTESIEFVQSLWHAVKDRCNRLKQNNSEEGTMGLESDEKRPLTLGDTPIAFADDDHSRLHVKYE